MGKIHVLPERVANQIAAGEVVERPASVVKELLENALDAGSTRIRIQVEAGGKKLIQITDNGCGMVRDDAMLAFERHATSKIKDTDDLLSISTLGFRGEALPSIASVARLHLETRAEEEAAGTVLEINGGKIIRVEEAGLPLGTSITIRDLFFNTPARKKFLRSESTELSHIASLVTHYALAHPEKHFELHSATNALLVAPPVTGHRERVYQVFGRETLDQLIPLAAVQPLERIGLPQPPPWRRAADTCGAGALAREASSSPPAESHAADFGEVRLHGFVSKPEIQKLNRNSIFIFVNGRLIRDRLIQHGITEAYRDSRFRAGVGTGGADEGTAGTSVFDGDWRATQRESRPYSNSHHPGRAKRRWSAPRPVARPARASGGRRIHAASGGNSRGHGAPRI